MKLSISKKQATTNMNVVNIILCPSL